MVLYMKDTFTVFSRIVNYETQEMKSVDIFKQSYERPYLRGTVMTDEDSLLIRNLWLLQNHL